LVECWHGCDGVYLLFNNETQALVTLVVTCQHLTCAKAIFGSSLVTLGLQQMLSFLPLTDGHKLRLFRENDPATQWWSLDEMRFCAKCGHLLLGRDIKVYQDEHGQLHFRCPSFNCDARWGDWQYPQLHL
jgi:hypothetical protein